MMSYCCYNPEVISFPPLFVHLFITFYHAHFPLYRWAWVTELPPDAAQRQFCHELLGRLVRLSFWKRIHQVDNAWGSAGM